MRYLGRATCPFTMGLGFFITDKLCVFSIGFITPFGTFEFQFNK